MSPTHRNALLLLAALGVVGCENHLADCEPTEVFNDDTGGGALELCDTLDNDGDGRVDEGWPDYDNDGEADCAPPPEECNSLDDDFDGFVDEDFWDEDGVADCFDCELETPQADTVDLTCTGELFNSVGAPAVSFNWAGFALGRTVYYKDSLPTPLVSALFDDDGDGDVDGDDDPVVAVLHQEFIDRPDIVEDSMLTLIDPRGGNTNFYDEFMDDRFVNSFGDPFLSLLSMDSGHAIADVDGDGTPNIVVLARDGTVVALEPDGSVLWVSNDGAGNDVRLGAEYYLDSRNEEMLRYPHQPTVADLVGDGIPEVIAYDLVISGDTGRAFTLAVNTDVLLTMPAVGDIDLDGEQEILIGGDCFEYDGARCWSTGVLGDGVAIFNQDNDTGPVGHWNAIVQYDSDPEAEIIAIGNGEYGLYEHDGTEIIRMTATVESFAGPPCVADFDDDGEPEVAWSDGSELSVFNLDGSYLWSLPVVDNGVRYFPDLVNHPLFEVEVPAGAAACSAFDFDNTGGYELLYADQEAFYILSGSGTVLFEYTNHNSETAIGYPVVADYDGDGSAEILLSSSNMSNPGDVSGLTIFEDSANPEGWAPGPRGWPIHDFAGSNMGEAGQVPGPEATYWLNDNVYRGFPGEPPAPDLQVEIVDVCSEDCTIATSRTAVSVVVSNTGVGTVDEVVVHLYGVDGSGVRIEPYLELATFTNLAGGTSSAAQVITFPSVDINAQGIVDLRAVVDQSDDFAECDETNNVFDWVDDDGDLCTN